MVTCPVITVIARTRRQFPIQDDSPFQKKCRIKIKIVFFKNHVCFFCRSQYNPLSEFQAQPHNLKTTSVQPSPLFLQHSVWTKRRYCPMSRSLQMPAMEILSQTPCQQEPRQWQTLRQAAPQTQVTSSCLWDSWRGHVVNSFLKYILLIFGLRCWFWRQYEKLRSLGEAIGSCLRKVKQEHETRLILHPFSFLIVSYPSETLPLSSKNHLGLSEQKVNFPDKTLLTPVKSGLSGSCGQTLFESLLFGHVL